MRVRLPIALASLAALSSLGCELDPGPRELPFPRFDPRQPFPELTAGEDGEGDDLSVGAPSSFERAIQDARSEEGASPPTSGTVSLQAIPLASILVADVPAEFGEWSYATDGTVTLIAHRTPGSMPDAIVYVEAFSPAMETFPSYEISRFQYTIAPSLSAAVIYPPLLGLGWQWVRGKLGAPPLDALAAMQRATTRTAGWGVGYSPTAGTFTGWKWVGENEHEVRLRTGRTTGSWASPEPPGADVARAVLDQMAEQIPELGRVAEEIATSVSELGRRPPSAAWMVFGSATRRNGLGVHVAVLCEQRPVCPVSADIARMLASMRAPSEGEQLASGEGDVVAFAKDSGLSLLPREDVIDAPRMVALLAKAMAKEKAAEAAEAAAEGGAIPGLEGLPIPKEAKDLLDKAGGPGGAPGLGEGLETLKEVLPTGEPGSTEPIPIPIP